MAPETQTVVQAAQSWLKSSCQIQVPFAWLEACVQWLQEEAGGAGRLSQQQINKQAYDQWLLTDLRDLDYPVLPDDLAQTQKTVISGIFCIQVDSVLDISQPAYGQLQKWKGTDCANDEVSAVTQFTQRPWEAKPTRMLLLQVTDGVQNLEAMEYQHIPALSGSLRPGVKIQLQGDIICRLGVMLLGPANVKLLGGEVEDLVDRNNQGRVLCRTLGLSEEEEQPQQEEEDPPSAQQGNHDFEDLDVDDQELLASLEAQEQADRLHRVGSPCDSGYGTLFESTSSQSSARNPNATASSRSETSSLSIRRSIPLSISSNRGGGGSTLGHFHSREPDDILEHFPQDPPTPDPPTQGPPTQEQSMADFPDDDFDDLPLDELDSVVLPDYRSDPSQNSDNMQFVEELATTEFETSTLGENTAKSANSLTLTSPPFTYICLLDDSTTSSKTEILVKAFIVTLLGKLTSSNGSWQVDATISDGTGYLDVQLSDKVLKGLLGFSVAEKAALKRDPTRKGELEAGMKRCQEELVDMCCVMTVSVDKEGGKALVTKAEPVKEQDVQALEQRVKARK